MTFHFGWWFFSLREQQKNSKIKDSGFCAYFSEQPVEGVIASLIVHINTQIQ